MGDAVVSLVSGASDAERAQRLRADLEGPLAKVIEVVNEARRDGLVVSFNIGPDAYGRIVVKELSIVRPL